MTEQVNIDIPALSLVVLVGPSGAGKSTFAHRHFLPTEIVSSDFCRALIADDETDQSVSAQAFDLLHRIAATRLGLGRLTVIDATSVKAEDRKSLIQLARDHHCLPVAVVFDLPLGVCRARNAVRDDRNIPDGAVRNQQSSMRRSLRFLRKEGFRKSFIFKNEDEVNAATVTRARLWNDRRDDHGPFDIIGDVHGCCDELETLLATLGYRLVADESGMPVWWHPEGRRAIFLGDLGDRGPRSLDAFRLVMNMVEAGRALCVPGNHDAKLLRKLNGRNVQATHGLQTTLDEIDAIPAERRDEEIGRLRDFIDGLVSHYVLDGGKLVVAHAGMKEEWQGRASRVVRDFAMYGDTDGTADEYGLPVRNEWAMAYRGRARVVYGHTPVERPEWLNRTINIDTGCVYGGSLTALRYPELETISVKSARTYWERRKPFLKSDDRTAQQRHDDMLDIRDLTGKRVITTALVPHVKINAEQSAAGMEAMSRFAVDPRWLIHLPPTMSPCDTSDRDGILEFPTEAFCYFERQRVERVICQEKHMGSRAIVVLCRDDRVTRQRFGIPEGGLGMIYTRTGRAFHAVDADRDAVLQRLKSAMDVAGAWETLESDWICLDCEIMPWSAKAMALIKEQYAAVGTAANHALTETRDALSSARQRGLDVEDLDRRHEVRQDMTRRFVEAYRHYCWHVDSVDALRIAPFHVLATEGRTYFDRDHAWHMATIGTICEAGAPFVQATAHRIVDLSHDAAVHEATEWWQALTANGGEGMVVKPLDLLARGKRGWAQPAIKCRGREYLRIIYGPEYTTETHIARLRGRSLRRKRQLAISEWALGVEALERFVRREPLRRTHECVFAILALESEPVDPRL